MESVQRVLKPTGTLYLCCYPKYAAQIEVLISKLFNVLSHIVWIKGDKGEHGVWSKTSKELLRAPFPQTERIIMAEQKNDGLDAVYAPLANYFQQAKKVAGLSGKQIQDQMYLLTGSRYSFERHTFSISQWSMPSKSQYQASQTFMPLHRSYESVRAEYDALHEQYKNSRRTFNVTPDVPYTDVWRFTTLPPGHKDRIHPAQKLLPLLRHIISISSKPGDTVLDPFTGSGSTLIAAESLRRKAIGIEKDARYCELIRKRESVQLVLL